MAIYSLQKDKILDVAGQFDVIGSFDTKIYVRGEDLLEPFVLDELREEIKKDIEERVKRKKEAKEFELNEECKKRLKDFKSSALGQEHIYDLGLEDQANLMGLILADTSGFFRCKKQGQDKENIPHTKEQLQQVFKDGAAHKSNTIYICGVLKSYLSGLEDEEAIQNLNWESYKKLGEQNE